MRVIVVGAGPSGLACAACLTRRGLRPVIYDRAESVGASWTTRYDGLQLHTSRGRSGLPFLPMPKHYGRYPGRDDVVAYLRDYAGAFDLDIRLGVTVGAVRPAEGGGWRVETGAGIEAADAVVFATGMADRPVRPDLPGYGGRVLHSCDYRNAQGFEGQRVLVVGLGNSGGEIALQLAQAGNQVALSVRGPVNLLPKELFGIPVTSLGGLRRVLPYRWVDAMTAPLLRLVLGRPEAFGLRKAAKGPTAQVVEDGRIPLIDTGVLAEIRAGRIAVRPAIAGADGLQMRFEGGGAGEYDAVVLATGYRCDLRALLPETPQALDDAGRPRQSGAGRRGQGPVAGLYFCSYHASADGQLYQSGKEARAIARAIAAG